MLGRIWNYVSNNPLIAGLLVLLITSGSAWAWVAPARMWLSADVRIVRGVLVVFALLLLIALAVILRLATALRRERKRPRPTAPPGFEPHRFVRPVEAPPQLTTSAAASPLTKVLPMPTRELPVPVQFAPEKFELTGPRARALLVLLEHIEARISLHTIHQAVQRYQQYVDMNTIKARVQRDMEEAAAAGIVRVETVTGGGDALCYRLTTEGRDWALRNEGELKRFAPRGMTVADRFT